jgi:hypothetical protein
VSAAEDTRCAPTRWSNKSVYVAAQNVCFWHKADIGGSELLLRKMSTGPYSSGCKFLI